VKEGVVHVGHQRRGRNRQYRWPKVTDEAAARRWFDGSCYYSAQQTSDPYPITFRKTIHEFVALSDFIERDLSTVERLDFMTTQQEIGVYRVDFVLGRLAPDVDQRPGTSHPQVLRKLPLVIVECDGHDFHERTKEQAQHDKARDRFLIASGFQVMHFTGTEIHRSPLHCAKEVEHLFENLYAARSFPSPSATEGRNDA
jgi:very-short-patch-repair endonuclease